MTSSAPPANTSSSPRPAAPPILRDKVVLVSGVGPDLGRSLAVRAAEAGADVVLAARNLERLESVAREVEALGRRAISVPTDISDASARRNLASAAVDAFGRVDVLINAAFRHPSNDRLLDRDLDRMRYTSDINVLASVGLVQELAATLTAHRGSVVLINSIVLRNRLAGYGSYRMDKAALLAAARGLSVELAPLGVRVNTVAPGHIWGEKIRGFFDALEAEGGPTTAERYREIAEATDSRRLPTPDEIADVALFLASDFASGVTGQCVDVSCGETHH